MATQARRSPPSAHSFPTSPHQIIEQLDALLEGFSELVPPSLISIFSPEELELLLAGLPHIDVADLRANTEYAGLRPTDELVSWFWAAVESFSEQDRARLLMFVTGTSKVPLGGFKDLRGQRGPQKFTLQRAHAANPAFSLPASHPGFNQLDLPNCADGGRGGGGRGGAQSSRLGFSPPLYPLSSPAPAQTLTLRRCAISCSSRFGRALRGSASRERNLGRPTGGGACGRSVTHFGFS